MNLEAVKYSRIEYARRFIVEPGSDWKNFVEPYSKTHEDKYLRGSRLRLRILKDSDSDRQLLKLTKKFESDSPYVRQIITLILSPGEYELLDGLEGNRVRKTRCYHSYLGQIFSIDVFEGELSSLLICETERDSLEDLMSAEFPAYASREVTEDAFFTGGNLCQTTHTELFEKLSAI
jgi:CYTH domain-containing protein